MIYTETDLATQERNAWQRGDTALAEATAAAMQADDLQAENERLQGVVESIDALIVESVWRTGKKAELVELIEAIRGELREGG